MQRLWDDLQSQAPLRDLPARVAEGLDRHERKQQAEMKHYWLMDGRANYDIDTAMVLETADTYAEAMESINDYGADTCIVEVDDDKETQELVYSLMWKDED
jgi:hypothetical protein